MVVNDKRRGFKPCQKGSMSNKKYLRKNEFRVRGFLKSLLSYWIKTRIERVRMLVNLVYKFKCSKYAYKKGSEIYV